MIRFCFVSAYGREEHAMLSVYDTFCNGLREPRGVTGTLRLSWRLGSDHAGAYQVAYDVVVVSLWSGDVLWDSGRVESAGTHCIYEGVLPAAEEICSWFVTVEDNNGEQVQSLPTVFIVGAPGDVIMSDWDEQVRGLVWTSSEELNEALEEPPTSSASDANDLHAPVWRELLGVAVEGRHVCIEPHLSLDLVFAQGSYLLDQGLLVVRIEREAQRERLKVSLPPGTTAELVLGTEHREVSSGQHVLYNTSA